MVHTSGLALLISILPDSQILIGEPALMVWGVTREKEKKPCVKQGWHFLQLVNNLIGPLERRAGWEGGAKWRGVESVEGGSMQGMWARCMEVR